MNDADREYKQAARRRDKVLKQLDKATKHMTADELYELGKAYRDGKDGGEPMPEMAIPYFVKAGQRGHAEAQYAFAYMCEHGIGTEVDMPLAAEWYGLAEYDKLIAAIKKSGGAVNPGASEKELDKLQRILKKRYHAPALEGYAAFLKKANGFRCREFELYPCAEAVAANKKNSGRFLVGRKKKHFMAYDSLTGKYCTLIENIKAFYRGPVFGHDSRWRPVRVKKAEPDGPVYDIVDTYGTFAEMVKALLKGWV